MNKETLELAAEKFYPIKTDDLICSPKLVRDAYIAGAKSNWVEKQKLQFAIEQLNKLDSVLQSKYEILSNMQQEYLGKMKEGQLASKKSGLRLAKEEIRRDIKDLEQKLSEL